MKLKNPLLVGLVILAAQAQAAVKDQSVKYLLAIQQDDQLIHEARRQPFHFKVEVVSDSDGVEAETSQNGRPFVTAVNGEAFSVRLYNPLPVQVAVNLTVDGLNSISGKPSGITDGQKWMIEPYSSITIPGWQVDGGTARRFFFTDKPKSYAQWRGDTTGRDLSANCGVIGAAYFWSQKELDQYYDDHPIVRYTRHTWNLLSSSARACDGAGASNLPACAPLSEMEKDKKESMDEQQAGTGMGEAQSHPTYQVAFDYDCGMYRPDQAVVIYYDFAKAPEPNPFPAEDYAPQP